MTPRIHENYQYWRDHGGAWADEYARRKTWMVLYHIQEIMLTEYVLRHAEAKAEGPLRVLEFGCGVGRHLSNLDRMPNVEVHGFDQSAAMVEGCRRWADAGFLRDRVTVGEPTGRLPYEDSTFDIVYSAEVLVHVRPEDIRGTLRELVRICRGHVLHIEPSPDFAVDASVHDGCWNHDLPTLYQEMGRVCESLGRGYLAHSAWRTVIGDAPVFRWKPELLEMYRKMETDIDRGFSVTDHAKREAEAKAAIWTTRAAELEGHLRSSLDSLRSGTASLESTAEALKVAQQTIAELRIIDAARTHTIGRLEQELKDAAARVAASDCEAATARDRLAESIKEVERAQLARTAEEQERARGWSVTLDALRAEARSARMESAVVKDRHAQFVNTLKSKLRRP